MPAELEALLDERDRSLLTGTGFYEATSRSGRKPDFSVHAITLDDMSFSLPFSSSHSDTTLLSGGTPVTQSNADFRPSSTESSTASGVSQQSTGKFSPSFSETQASHDLSYPAWPRELPGPSLTKRL